MKLFDRTGLKLGRLTVLRETGTRDGNGNKLWLCGCRCGWYTEVSTNRLGGKRPTLTCGNCNTSRRWPVEYQIWAGIYQRCYNSLNASYSHYGGRGIQMSPEWKLEFFNFLEDMGMRESYDLSIDRIDPNGDYCKENCRWATKQEQIDNRRPYIVVPKNYSHLSKSQILELLASDTSDTLIHVTKE